MAERLALVEDLTIYHAAPLKERLQAAVAALAVGDSLELDLSAVSEIDTSGVQLLLMTVREAAREGRHARVAAMSPAVAEVIAFLNLGAQLET